MEEKNIFCIGNFSAKPGEKKTGFLSIGNGEFQLPISILHGRESGKTVLITAGIHAEEYVGIQASIELTEALNPEQIKGTVVIVKVINREAFELRSGSECYAERLAYAVEKELLCIADYYIDLHSGDSYEQLTPYVYFAGAAQEQAAAKSREMAQQVDVPYMVNSNVTSGGCYNYAASIGIPSILIERGQMGGWNEEESHSTRRDVKNILCHLGVYQEERDCRNYYPLEVKDVSYQAANQMGLWYPFKKPGDTIQEGELLGEIRDYEGKILEVCRAEYSGVILYQTGSLQVKESGPVIAYGKIVRESDNRKQQITRYWTKRSDSFQIQRREELHCYMAERWMAEIKKYMPEGNLKILDVGCGSGFFTILLAKLGHEVIGIDLTPEMIERSKELAKEEAVSCRFEIIDAENLEFQDETFDFVISRNLTWTLPEAGRAYGEWCRVLKKGGVLLNFDANYGNSCATEISSLPKEHAHNMLGMEMLIENENIKKQLPISSYIRPAWDVETLGRLEIQEISLDLGVGKRIYSEKDEFYNPVPIFTLCAKK